MPDALDTFWSGLSATTQDTVVLTMLILPALVVGLVVTAGFQPFGLVGAMMWRYRWTNALFVGLIAVSVGIGVGLIAQERGLRTGTAHAAEKFDLVVTAPGSEVQMLLATVYLQPVDVELLGGDLMHEISTHEHVDLAAPIAHGDSYGSYPVIGTTPQFVSHLSGDLAEGRMFAEHTGAVVGARVDLAMGDTFEPAHGVGHGAEEGAHAGHDLVVVGRMAPTGSPWDKAILIPVESVWEVHGLANGHPPEAEDQIGPPFDPDYFPGTPAILVRADELWANYALKSELTRSDAMAFFPGTVLAQLHGLLGDIRQVMSVMAVVTQILVTAGVLAGLVVLSRLFARGLALLRALGAPRRFVFAIVWCHAAALIGAGAMLGLALGLVATKVISRIVTERTDILVQAQLGWPELHLVAAFISLTVILSLLPAFAALRRPVVSDLRS